MPVILPSMPVSLQAYAIQFAIICNLVYQHMSVSLPAHASQFIIICSQNE